MGSIGRYTFHTGLGAVANIRVSLVEFVRASGTRFVVVFGLKNLFVRPLTRHLRTSASAIGELIANGVAS
jgi:hypothetical protein